MKLTVKEIAEKISADVIGDENRIIERAAAFQDATFDALTFALESKYLSLLDTSNAGAVIVPKDFTGDNAGEIRAALLRSENAKDDFFTVAKLLHPSKEPEKRVSVHAVIGRNIRLGNDVTIDANVYIGDNVSLGDSVEIMPNVTIQDNVVIGDHTIIKPNVVITENCKIGSRVLIHSGTVIGSDGFGFTRRRGRHNKIVHTGMVKIDDDVEIGACNAIDRGTFGRTWIQSGVKTDNLVHIAHNVIIGKNSLLVAQTGIAGSSRIGESVIIAGKAGISGHLSIGDGSTVGPLAGVVSNVAPGEVVSGMPHMPHKLWLKISRIIPRLPDMRKTLSLLEKRVNKLEKRE